MGPHAPDAHRRRLHDARGHRGPAGGGPAGQPRERHVAPPGRLDDARAGGLAGGRPAHGPVDVPGRVRLRRAPVPLRDAADADHAGRRRRAGGRAPMGRPRHRAGRRGVLPRRARRPGAGRRARARREHAALPAVPRGGAGGGGRRARARGRAPAAGLRAVVAASGIGTARPGRRVGLVARVDAHPVAVEPAARGRAAGAGHGRRRRRARRLDRVAPRRGAAPAPARPAPGRAGVGRRGVRAAGLRPCSSPPTTAIRGQVALTELRGGAEREVAAEVTLDPPDAADDARLAHRDRVAGRRTGGRPARARSGPGRYRTTEPVPVHGEWKALVRLHSGRSLTALPVYLPEDRGDPRRARSRPPPRSRATSCPTTRSCSASRRTPRRA